MSLRRVIAADELERPSSAANPSMTWSQALLWSAVAVISFHLAYSLKGFNWVILFYLVGLVKLASAKTSRIAFYLGFAVGLLVVAPRLTCFWNIFGMAAMALWCVVAFWTGLFVSLSQACLKRLGPVSGALLVAFLWTGLEYFRSELYYLKFSWLNIGYCFSDSPTLPVVGVLGMYGLGFTTALVAALIARVSSKQGLRLAARFALIVMVVLFAWAYLMERESTVTTAKSVTVAGVQLEFPTEREVLAELDKLIATTPEAELFVLSEYTLSGPVPQTILDWCRSHQRYLIVGGKDPAPNDNFYDTAFVVDPNGAVVFRQVKSVPIQFF
jgi:apolipoprotein N-acyltransferase